MAWGGETTRYDVCRYGAVGDTTRLSTVAIQRAIDDCATHGQSGVCMEGFSGRIRNIRIDNFQLFMHPEDAVDKRSCHGFHFYGVDGLKMHRCSVVWDKENPEPTWQKAYSFEEVTGLEEMNNEGMNYE